MVKSHCVKEKKQTECVQPSGYKEKNKNGRTMFQKAAFCEKTGKLAGCGGGRSGYYCRYCIRHVCCASRSSLDGKGGAGNGTILWFRRIEKSKITKESY